MVLGYMTIAVVVLVLVVFPLVAVVQLLRYAWLKHKEKQIREAIFGKDKKRR